MRLLGVSAGVVLAALVPSTLVSLVAGTMAAVVAGLSWWLVHKGNTCKQTRDESCESASSGVSGESVRGLRAGRALCAGLLAGLVAASVQFYVHERAQPTGVMVKRVSGCIVSPVVSRNDAHRFVFESMARTAMGRAVRYRVAWYQNEIAPNAGSCWRFTLRLKPPRGARNEAGFDYERWLFAQRLHGLGSVRSGSHAVQLPWNSTNAAYLEARTSLFRQLSTLTADHRSSMLIGALAVGMRDGLTDDDWRILKRTGTAHLMAISGLHVGLAAMFGFVVGRFAPVRLHASANLARRGALTSLLVAFVYAAIAGFAVSTVRALLMLLLWHVWRMLFRCVHVTTTLLLTVAGVLLWYPWMAVDVGFWLSAGAVAAIATAAYGQPPTENWRQKALLALRIQLGITLLMLPVAVLVAEGISWISIPVNLLLIPLFSVCVVPLVLLLLAFLYTVPGLAALCASLLGLVLDTIWLVLSWLAGQSWAFTGLAAISAWVTVPVVLCGVLLLLPRAFPARHIGWIMLLPLFFYRTERPEHGEFWLDVLDVGQALALIVQTKTATLVYDTGNAWPGGDSGDRTLLPVLRRRGVEQLQVLIVSHADRDHAGGAVRLQQTLPIHTVWVGESVPGLHDSRRCHRGVKWQQDGVRFEFLHPPPGSVYEGNPASCVLFIQSNAGAALLTGDLGKTHERLLLASLEAQTIDVIVGAHHGSMSSSDPLFAAATHPEYVVFSNGYGNQWGMPRPAVVARWTSAGTRVLTTARSGQIRFSSQSDGPLRLTERLRHRGPGRWRWRPEEN